MSKKAGAAPKSDPNRVYHPDDIVLGKIKGYPMWPAHVVPNDLAPPNVVKEKPKGKATHYLVQFFPAADFGWLNARDMIPLTPEKIEQHLQTTGKKGGELTKAYKIARDPSDWKAGIVSRQIEYEQLQAAALEDHDELQSEEEPGSKKRKHKSDAGAKKTGADKKAKLSQPSKPKASSSKETADSAPAKKSKAGSEDDSPGLKQVRDWRQKLQKAFLGAKDGQEFQIKAEDMPKCNEYFKSMESFDMKKEWLAETKLAKVLKRIALREDDAIPGEDQYHFKNRSTALAQKWMSDGGPVSADTPKGGAEATPDATPSAPADVSQTGSAPAETAPAPVHENKPTTPAQSNGASTAGPAESAPVINGESESKPAAPPAETVDSAPAVAPAADTPMEV